MTAVTPRRTTRLQENSTPSRSTSSANDSAAASTPSSSGSSSSPVPSTTTATTSYPTMAAKSSPSLPTAMETVLLLLYPTTLLLGSLFALVDPATRASTYLTASQAHDPAFAPSYFARKGNLFNQLFVKRGWFWITISYFYFLFTHPATGPGGSAILTRKRLQGVLRWTIVTVWWVFVTQWFFGPAIIDRSFILTGGACELVGMVDEEKGKAAREFLTGIACKANGGKWSGGHDISGHVFLLVMGSMFLFEEVLFVVLRATRAKEERLVLASSGEVKNADTEVELETAENTKSPWDLGVKFALGVGALSIWMLLMTAAYFHTWFEKFTGLVVAFVGVFVVYFLPRSLPSFRAIIGMPGV